MASEIHLFINYKSNVTPVNARHYKTMYTDVQIYQHLRWSINWAMSQPNIRKR